MAKINKRSQFIMEINIVSTKEVKINKNVVLRYKSKCTGYHGIHLKRHLGDYEFLCVIVRVSSIEDHTSPL